MKKINQIALALAFVAVPATAFAQEPVENISHNRHGNLASAQDLARQAYDRITAAQQANEFDLGGHAAKAKQLLEQVNDELKLAAEAANHNH
jgi:F0F1-type ATP synthase membrane subunit b/b'